LLTAVILGSSAQNLNEICQHLYDEALLTIGLLLTDRRLRCCDRNFDGWGDPLQLQIWLVSLI